MTFFPLLSFPEKFLISVHDILRLALQIHRHILKGNDCALSKGLFRRKTDMRCQECIWRLKERIVRSDWRLTIEDINAGRGNRAIGQGLGQRCCIDDRTAGRVDENSRRLHQSEL